MDAHKIEGLFQMDLFWFKEFLDVVNIFINESDLEEQWIKANIEDEENADNDDNSDERLVR